MAKSKVSKIGIGIGVAAVVAAAAGAYFLYGKNGAKHRKQLKSWMVKMKAEVMEGLENMKEVTGPVYNRVVDEVAKRYAKVRNVSPKELAALVREMKGHWRSISREFGAKPKPRKK
ncbi:MAG: hypothetical protein V1856_02660 [Candidatus Liptonbacteria bacterium]